MNVQQAVEQRVVVLSIESLKEKSHPEVRHTPFQIACHQIRRGIYSALLTHQAEPLRFAVRDLPEELRIYGQTSAAFNSTSLRPKWFEDIKNLEVVSATIHTRHAFWLVRPDFADLLPIPKAPF